MDCVREKFAEKDNGKMAAFQKLYMDNYDLLLKYVVHALGCKEEKTIEFVIQDTFYEAMNHMEVLEGLQKPECWLMKTAAQKLAVCNRDDDR